MSQYSVRVCFFIKRTQLGECLSYQDRRPLFYRNLNMRYLRGNFHTFRIFSFWSYEAIWRNTSSSGTSQKHVTRYITFMSVPAYLTYPYIHFRGLQLEIKAKHIKLNIWKSKKFSLLSFSWWFPHKIHISSSPQQNPDRRDYEEIQEFCLEILYVFENFVCHPKSCHEKAIIMDELLIRGYDGETG